MSSHWKERGTEVPPVWPLLSPGCDTGQVTLSVWVLVVVFFFLNLLYFGLREKERFAVLIIHAFIG